MSRDRNGTLGRDHENHGRSETREYDESCPRARCNDTDAQDGNRNPDDSVISQLAEVVVDDCTIGIFVHTILLIDFIDLYEFPDEIVDRSHT